MKNRWYEKKVLPKRYVYHVTVEMHRESIGKNGLIPKNSKESQWGVKSMNDQYPAMVFANNTEVFYDFFYFDDPVRPYYNYDIWRIDTAAFKADWYLDLNISWRDFYICTPNHIPREAITQMQITKGFCRICNEVYDRSVVSQVLEVFRNDNHVFSDKVYSCCYDKFREEYESQFCHQVEEYVEKYGRYRCF
jgi:hypothetical protein